MSVLLRYLIIISVISLLIVGCGQKQVEPIEAAPASVAEPAAEKSVPVTPVTEESTATGGGYEPTTDERVPGITLDAATVDAAAASASETVPVVTPIAK